MKDLNNLVLYLIPYYLASLQLLFLNNKGEREIDGGRDMPDGRDKHRQEQKESLVGVKDETGCSYEKEREITMN